MSLIQFTSCPCNFSSNLRIGINFFSKMMCQIMCYYMALSTTTYSLGVALYFDRDTHHYHKNVPTYLGFTLHVCKHNTIHVGIQNMRDTYVCCLHIKLYCNCVRFELGLAIVITNLLVLLGTKFILYRY